MVVCLHFIRRRGRTDKTLCNGYAVCGVVLQHLLYACIADCVFTQQQHVVREVDGWDGSVGEKKGMNAVYVRKSLHRFVLVFVYHHTDVF